MKKLWITCVILISLGSALSPQDGNNQNGKKLAERIRLESRYYGLIIGIDEYADDSIPDLKYPVNDAENLYNLLTGDYGFKKSNTILLRSAGKDAILKSFEKLARKVTPDDMLLVYFAGHGDMDPETDEGYWLPSDAGKNYIDNWISNEQVIGFMKKIRSRHTLLIVDAGFSGTIFKARLAFGGAAFSLEELYDHPSRKAMTSGALTIVPDESVFSRYFTLALSANQVPVITSEKLFSGFRMDVINHGETIPQYGTLSGTGDEGGDFIFLRLK